MAAVNVRTWSINKDLLPVKATYFFIFAGIVYELAVLYKFITYVSVNMQSS